MLPSTALLASSSRSRTSKLASPSSRPQLRRTSHSLDVSKIDFSFSPVMTQSARQGPMPGSFNSHQTPSYVTGRKSNVYKPPTTPIPSSASSSTYLTRSTMSLCEDSGRDNVTSRKRTRYEYTANSITPISSLPDWSTGLDTGDPMARSGSIDPGSPMPLVNTRYRLRGGLDTPGAAAVSAQEAADSEYYDKGFRKDLGGDRRPDEPHTDFSFFPPIETPPSAGNGSTRSQMKEGWSKAAFEVVGGVVGKVWEFCAKNAPFRGFIAGGGTAYNQSARPITPNEDTFWRDDITRFNEAQARGTSTPVPGQFPEDDFIPDYMDNPTPRDDERSTPQRPAKRRQLSSNSQQSSELEKNWIMVQPSPISGTNKPLNRQAPPKLQSRYSMPTSASSNRRLTGASASRAPNLGARRTAVSRSSTAGVSYAGSPGLHSRGASFASPRSPGGSKIPIPSYPLSPSKAGRMGGAGAPESPAAIEAAKWAAKKKMEERESDEAMRRLNKQMRDMIRQGKEALGSKISVHDGEDEGFEDEY